MPDPDLLGPVIADAIRAYGLASPRTQQSQAGVIGPSDLGFCRMKAALMLTGHGQSDARSIWAAQHGTAWHEYIKTALSERFPDWRIDAERVTATFPNGAEVSGTPDLVTLSEDWNAVVDAKTCDGVADYARLGATQNHRFQRHTYAMGAIAKGWLDPTRPIIVGNLYFDRRGKDQPLWLWEYMDDALTIEIDSWLSDVIYAAAHGEEASRDIPAPVCEIICEHFSTCRGGLPMQESQVYDDPRIIDMANMYDEGRAMKKQGDELMRIGRRELYDVNGIAGEWQIRWNEVVNQTTGEVSTRLDVRRMRRRQ